MLQIVRIISEKHDEQILLPVSLMRILPSVARFWGITDTKMIDSRFLKAHLDQTRSEVIDDLKNLETTILNSKVDLINIVDIDIFKTKTFDKIANILVNLVANQVEICTNREIDIGFQTIDLSGYYNEGFSDLGILVYGGDNLYHSFKIKSLDDAISGDYNSSIGRMKENRPSNEPFMNFVEDMLFLIKKLVELLEKKIQKN